MLEMLRRSSNRGHREVHRARSIERVFGACASFDRRLGTLQITQKEKANAALFVAVGRPVLLLGIYNKLVSSTDRTHRLTRGIRRDGD